MKGSIQHEFRSEESAIRGAARTAAPAATCAAIIEGWRAPPEGSAWKRMRKRERCGDW